MNPIDTDFYKVFFIDSKSMKVLNIDQEQISKYNINYENFIFLLNREKINKDEYFYKKAALWFLNNTPDSKYNEILNNTKIKRIRDIFMRFIDSELTIDKTKPNRVVEMFNDDVIHKRFCCLCARVYNTTLIKGKLVCDNCYNIVKGVDKYNKQNKKKSGKKNGTRS